MLEIICLHCGAKAMAKRPNMKFCSKKCCDRYYAILSRKPDYMPEIAQDLKCPNNEAVECRVHKCSACGWNPVVAQKRMEARW